MARKRSTARLLLDTSAVVHQLHGHTLQQAAVREAVAVARCWCRSSSAWNTCVA